MSVVVVATIAPLPEHREAVVAAFESAIPAVHAEPGCELYALHESADKLVMIEKWASKEDLATHSGGDALRELGRALKGKVVAAADVSVLTAHPAGDASLGAL